MFIRIQQSRFIKRFKKEFQGGVIDMFYCSVILKWVNMTVGQVKIIMFCLTLFHFTVKLFPLYLDDNSGQFMDGWGNQNTQRYSLTYHQWTDKPFNTRFCWRMYSFFIHSEMLYLLYVALFCKCQISLIRRWLKCIPGVDFSWSYLLESN